MDFPKKQQQCLIPRYLLQYLQDLQITHTDPTAPWGGGGGGGSYTAGDGIDITNDVISVDDTVALKTDLLDYVTTSELTTELSNYVTSTDLATELLDYAELDDIPTKTSDLTNDSGFITSSALTGYATENWVTNQGYSTFSGSYNDLTNKPTIPDAVSGTNDGTNWTSLTIGNTTYNIPSGGGSSYSGGTWINIDSNNSINVSNPYISLLDGSGNPRVMISSTSNGTAPTFTATYCNITPTGFGIVDKTQGSFGGYSAAYTYYRHRDILVNGKWSLSFPTDFGTIATQEWTRDWVTSQGYSKSSGTYSGSYWTSITIDGTTKGIPSGGSAPTNMATTNTDQDITGTKTFVGPKKIGFRQANASDVVGFTVYNTSQREIGNLQVANRTVGGNTYTYVTLGNYSDYSSKSKLGFRVQPNSSSDSFNFVMPYGTTTEFTSNTYSRLSDTTIPCAFTDGTTIVKADATGLVNISSISGGGGGGGTTVSGTNDGTNWTSITIGSDTYGIPSSGGGGGSSLAPQIYNFTSSDWTAGTKTNGYISNTAMSREGLDLSNINAGQTIKVDVIFKRPSNNEYYVHQFTLVMPDGTNATQTTDTFQIPNLTGNSGQIENWMDLSQGHIGIFWSNNSMDRYITKVKVYPANA